MTVDEVFRLFLRDFFFFAFFASLGALQVGAAAGGLRGMLLLPSPRLARWAGALLIVAAGVWFFASPLWYDGPWSSEFGDSPPGTEPRRTVEWGTASRDDFARARLVNDVDGGLSGTDQFAVFSGGAALAVLVTLGASSVFKRRQAGGRAGSPADGAELLKSGSYVAALRTSLRYWRETAGAEVRAQWDNPDHRGGLRDGYRRLKGWRGRRP